MLKAAMELLKYVKVRSVANFLSNSTTQFYNYQYLYKTTPSATVLYKLKSQKSSLEKKRDRAAEVAQKQLGSNPTKIFGQTSKKGVRKATTDHYSVGKSDKRS